MGAMKKVAGDAALQAVTIGPNPNPAACSTESSGISHSLLIRQTPGGGACLNYISFADLNIDAEKLHRSGSGGDRGNGDDGWAIALSQPFLCCPAAHAQRARGDDTVHFHHL